MKIYLFHYKKIDKIKDDWIFLGNSYLKLKKLKNKMAGNYINLQSEYHKEFDIQKKHILEWLEKQRIYNNDSLFWWMSHLSSRNNGVSKFFQDIIKIFCIKKYIKNNEKYEKDIIIICEDSFLIKSINENLDIYTNIKNLNYQIYFFYDLIYYFLRCLFTKLRSITFFIIHFYFAKQTRQKNIKPPVGEAFLFHHCLDTNYFKASNSISCRYFTILPSWLKNKGKKVYALPWLFNVKIPIKDIYSKLRNNETLIPEDWLNLKDYFFSITNSIKSAFSINDKIIYPGINLKSLIFREKLIQLGESSEIFWRYIPALRKWSSKLNSLIIYDRFENMMSEHTLRYFLKNLKINNLSIGFYHTLVSKEFLGYHSIFNEWQSNIKPDYVVCSGQKAFDKLIGQGAPKDRMLIGAGLRQERKLRKEKNYNIKNNKLLIITPLDISLCIELIDKVSSTEFIKNNKKNIKVSLKPHPMLNKKRLLKEIKMDKLPFNWKWEDREIESALKDVHCTVTLSSSASYDAILSGSIVISLMSDLILMDNTLDIFKNEFPIVEAVTSDQLSMRLSDVFFNKIEYYRSNFIELNNSISNAINPINDKNLDVFIPKSNMNLNEFTKSI